MTTIKERPVLFNGPMVRAILSGQKTVTRRFVPAWQLPSKTHDDERWISIAQRHPRWGFGVFGDTEEECMANYKTDYKSCCPYGQAGDRLWVRETFGCVSPDEYERPLDECNIEYRADLPPGCTDRPGQWPADECIGDPDRPRWRPSIHMPRAACRILLEITDVRVERLRDISGDQALAEGIYSNPSANGMYTADGDFHTSKSAGPVEAFAHPWESINGAGSWAVNPWVWVIEFKRVMP